MIKRSVLIALLTAGLACAGNLIANGPDNTLLWDLEAEVISQMAADKRKEVVQKLIQCRYLPTTQSEYEKAISKAQERGNEYAADAIAKEGRKCIGLSAKDFYQVEAILRQLSEEGVLSAQMSYWRYVSPSPAQRYSFSDPGISNALLAQRSERYLMSAASSGEYLALLNLSQLHFSGEMIPRNYHEAAAFIVAYEECSGKTVPSEANQIYLASKGLESQVADRSEALIKEIGCGQ